MVLFLCHFVCMLCFSCTLMSGAYRCLVLGAIYRARYSSTRCFASNLKQRPQTYFPPQNPLLVLGFSLQRLTYYIFSPLFSLNSFTVFVLLAVWASPLSVVFSEERLNSRTLKREILDVSVDSTTCSKHTPGPEACLIKYLYWASRCNINITLMWSPECRLFTELYKIVCVFARLVASSIATFFFFQNININL